MNEVLNLRPHYIAVSVFLGLALGAITGISNDVNQEAAFLVDTAGFWCLVFYFNIRRDKKYFVAFAKTACVAISAVFSYYAIFAIDGRYGHHAGYDGSGFRGFLLDVVPFSILAIITSLAIAFMPFGKRSNKLWIKVLSTPIPAALILDSARSLNHYHPVTPFWGDSTFVSSTFSMAIGFYLLFVVFFSRNSGTRAARFHEKLPGKET